MRSIMKKIACVCLLLTFWSAIAFSAHHHSSATESATCTVCVAAHSAVPKDAFHQAKVAYVSTFVFQAEPVSAKQRLIAFALRVRPPPAV
jgi:hypothetical protein